MLKDGAELVLLHESGNMLGRRRREADDRTLTRLPDTVARLACFTVLSLVREHVAADACCPHCGNGRQCRRPARPPGHGHRRPAHQQVPHRYEQTCLNPVAPALTLKTTRCPALSVKTASDGEVSVIVPCW